MGVVDRWWPSARVARVLAVVVAMAVVAGVVWWRAVPSPAEAATGTGDVTVAVQVSGSPVAAGSTVTATVAVTASVAGGPAPTGAVQFTVDGGDVGEPVPLSGGQAVRDLNALAVGAHTIGARYDGDSGYAPADAGPGATTVVVPAGASRFVAGQPTRVLDTRPGAQIGYTGAKLAAGTTVVIQIAGQAGVPESGATAVVLNVTATEAAGPGFITAFPTDTPRPLASNLNVERAGQTVPNLVVVPLADGRVSVYTQASAHLVADVAGYFTGALSATGGRLAPLAPARLLDTRNGTGYAGPRPAAGATVTVQAAGRGGVPAHGVAGVVLNVTATAADPNGYVTVWPAGTPRPLASNLNIAGSGLTISNAVWVPLSAAGAFSLYTSRAAHLVVDVAGWFTGDGAVHATSGLFVATPPARQLDTRPGPEQVGYTGPKPVPGTVVPLTVAGRAPVPASAVAAVVANVTATGTDGPGYVTAYPAGAIRPLASHLNLDRAAQTRPNLVTVPLAAGGLDLYTTSGTHLIADVAGYFTTDLNPPPAPIRRETYDLADGASFLEPSAVATVTGDATSGYNMTLAPGQPPPAIGAGIVLKGGGAAYPAGLSGTVTAVTASQDGTTHVTLAPTPIDEQFDQLDIAYTGPADLQLLATDTVPAARSAQKNAVTGSVDVDPSVLNFPAGAFQCSVNGGVTFSTALVRFANTRVVFEKRVGFLTTPFIQFYLTTEPIVEITGEIHGKVSCQLKPEWRPRNRLVWVLPTSVPVTVDLSPAFSFDAGAAGRMTFTQHFYRMVGLTTNPDLTPHFYNAGSSVTERVDVVGEVSASLMIGVDVSVKLLDVVGIGVTIGPQFKAAYDTTSCLRLTVSLRAEFDARLNLWIKELKAKLFNVEMGPWEMFTRCLGQWTQDGHDATRSGVNPAEGQIWAGNAASLRSVWQYTEPAGWTLSRPVVAGSTAYLTAYTGSTARLVAVNVTNGARIWQRTLPAAAYQAPVLAGGVVLIQSNAGIHAYSTSDGSPRWSNPSLPATICAAGNLAADGGTIYAFTSNGVSAVDATSGAIRWTRTVGVYCFTGVAVAGGRIFAVSRSTPPPGGTQQGQLRALDPRTGAVLWTITTPVTMDGEPATGAGMVFVGTQYDIQGMIAVDQRTGAIRWRRTDARTYRQTPAASNNAVVVTSDGAPQTWPTARSLNPVTGATLWSRTIPGAIAGADPVIANGLVYLGSRGNPKAIHVLRLDTGAPVATLQLGTGSGNYNIVPIVVNGTVLAAVTPDIGLGGTPTIPTLRAYRLP